MSSETGVYSKNEVMLKKINENSFHSDGLLHSSTLDIPGSRVTYLWVRVEVDDYRKVEK